jgi:serine/tyrosine/threonine adenylyltransferase
VLAWNLTRFAEVLLPLGEHAEMEAALNRYWPAFQRSIWTAILERLGLEPLGVDADSTLVTEMFSFLHAAQLGYEQFFFDWRGGDEVRAMRSPAAEHYRSEAFATLEGLIAAHPRAEGANLDHPYFKRETPRTMLIDEMEALWAPIAERDDWRALYEALGEIEEMREAYAVA